MPKARTKEEMKKFLLSKRGFNVEGCWLWLGATNSDNYGVTTFENRYWRVHKLAFMLFKPEEYEISSMVLHKINCTSPKCFNPDHLYSGTQKDNMQDRLKAGTNTNARKKMCPKGHEYSEENTYILPSTGYRRCKLCAKDNHEFHANVIALTKNAKPLFFTK